MKVDTESTTGLLAAVMTRFLARNLMSPEFIVLHVSPSFPGQHRSSDIDAPVAYKYLCYHKCVITSPAEDCMIVTSSHCSSAL